MIIAVYINSQEALYKLTFISAHVYLNRYEVFQTNLNKRI